MFDSTSRRAHEKAEGVIPEVTEPADYIDLEPVEDNIIIIRVGKFNPGTLRIASGEVVAWSNYNAAEHTVTSLENVMLDSGLLEKGGGSIHPYI